MVTLSALAPAAPEDTANNQRQRLGSCTCRWDFVFVFPILGAAAKEAASPNVVSLSAAAWWLLLPAWLLLLLLLPAVSSKQQHSRAVEETAIHV